MNKSIISIMFYFVAIMAIVFIFNNESVFLTFIGLMIIFSLMSFAKAFGKDVMYNILGINWLQKKFKNSELIMDMTNE